MWKSIYIANDPQWKPKEAREPHISSRKRSAQTGTPLYKVLASPLLGTDFAQILAQDAEISSEQSHKVSNPYAKPFRS